MKKLKVFTNRFRLKHVNHQIFVLMIATITIPLMVISAILYVFSLDAVKSEYQSSSNLILNNLSFNIDQYLQSIEKGTLNAQMDGQLLEALEQWNFQAIDNLEDQKLQYRYSIENFISSIEMTIKNLDSVQIYTGNRVFYSANFNPSDYVFKDFTQEPWYKKTLEQRGGVVLIGTHLPYHRVNAREPVISIARVINKVGSRNPLGVILLDIRLDSLREILKLSENSNRNFIIMDEQGGIIYNSAPDSSESEEIQLDSAVLHTVLGNHLGSFYAPIDGNKSYINFVTSPYSGWKVVQYIDEVEMTKPAELLRIITLALAFGSFGMALLFMFILYKRVTKPIIYLSRQVKLVGMGNFDVNIRSDRQDEFGVLYSGIQKMVQDLQVYIERSAMAKVQQKVAQFGALKSQINPHFLANSLESIQMKAIIQGQRDIAEMIGLLGRLFRFHIQTGKETVPLEEELKLIRLYIQVQQMRFGDRITYREQLSPGTESIHVMHFSLQPIVENAIVHGLERQAGGGVLEITTSIVGDDMLIQVKDSGGGMSEEQLQHLRDRISQPSNTLDEAHIGIKNVHDRIQYYFGECYGVEISSKRGEGTNITLRVPARQN
jgi:two-component system, sensor histidine kinase YesM